VTAIGHGKNTLIGRFVNANLTFEWVLLAQRILVGIQIDEVPKGVLVSSGMSATVVMEPPPRQWEFPAAVRPWFVALR
jgi:multidrug resistance efflux pump